MSKTETKKSQRLRKFWKFDEQHVRESLMKHLVLFCCFVVLVGAGAVYASYGHERIQAAVYATGAILASSVVLIQWESGVRVKRAELVDQLIDKMKTIDPNSLMEECGSGDMIELEKQDQDFSAKLSFLSYTAYLEATGILSDDEFNALKLDLVRILEHVKVVGMIEEACNGNNAANKDANTGSKLIPYRYLVKYGAANCKHGSAVRYKEILNRYESANHVPGNAEQTKDLAKEGSDDKAPDKDAVIDSVTSGKTYGTHVEVLNGIFKLSYRAHMRGCAALPKGRMVWFPKYYDSSMQVSIKAPTAEWVNILDSQKGVLSEYWPLGIEMTEERLDRWNKEPRYVFGMDKSRSPGVYRFLGVYQLAKREEDHLVYTRKSDVLRRDEIENLLNSGNY